MKFCLSLKLCLRFTIVNFSEKLQNIFEIGLKKYGVYETEIALIWKYISKEKIRRHVFVVYVLIYPLSKFGGNRTNSFWVLAFYSVRFKRKNWCEKTALNQTGNVYFRPKLKTAISLPIFNQLFQWFLFYIREFHFDHYVNRKTEIWRKLSIWRYTVTLKELCYVQCIDCFSGCSEWEGR